jgi:hypothetical protein
MFQTLGHTKQVVRAAQVIGRASKLTGEPLNTVMIAAWFHDLGYVDGVRHHEERSASIAAKMLATWGGDSKIIEDVSRCVRATKLPQNPKDILSMILCDAVLSQLTSPGDGTHPTWLCSEQEASPHCKLESQHVWYQRNIEFLNVHQYFTDYGKEILDRRKKANLTKMTHQVHGRHSTAII